MSIDGSCEEEANEVAVGSFWGQLGEDSFGHKFEEVMKVFRLYVRL